MKVVITGATGAIGMALIKKCLKEQDQILVITHKGSKRAEQIPNDKNITLLYADLEEYAQIDVQSMGVYDIFYHFAWNGTTGDGRNDMDLQVKNIQGSLEAVRLAKRFGCTAFIGAGSQAEYGRKEGMLTTDLPVSPENGYGIAKLCAGQMTRKRCESLGIRHIWTRILSVYGPWSDQSSMIINTLSHVMKNEKMMFTKGEQIWDYLYSEDAAEALYLLAQKGIGGKTYLIGSGKGKPLKEYIQVMYKLCGKKQPVFGQLPYAEGQVMFLQADISELTKDTGFVPKVSFEEGMQKTIEYMNLIMKYSDGVKR